MLLLLLACSSPTVATPVGPIGGSKVPLPEGVVAPANLDVHVHEASVCAWPEGEQPPAVVSLTWRTFGAGEDEHVVDYEVALVTPSPELEVRVLPHQGGPAGASLEPNAPWVGVAMVTFRCKREGRVGARAVSYDGADMIQLLADGTVR